MLKVGLIGRGSFGRKHEEKLLQLQDKGLIKYIGFYDPRYPVKSKYIEHLIGEGDAFVVATPPNTHYQMAMECLSRGKHVLVEKPMATNLWDAIRMQHKAEAQNVILAVGFLQRFYVPINDFTGTSYLKIINHSPKKAKNLVLDLGSHGIDLACWKLGDTICDIKKEGWEAPGSESPCVINIVIDFINQKRAEIEVGSDLSLNRTVNNFDLTEVDEDVLLKQDHAFVQSILSNRDKRLATGWNGIAALNIALRSQYEESSCTIFESNMFTTAILGHKVKIGFGCEIGHNVVVGDNTAVGAMAYIPEGAIIQENCFIGPRVTFTNDKYPPSNRENWEKIWVEDGASIGAGSVILPGVRIGKNSLVGAGSVVTKDVPENGKVAGNPAKPM